MIVPIPVTVGNTQQMAFIPVFANAEGKYVLPNGSEVGVGAPGNLAALTGGLNGNQKDTDA